MTGAGAVLTIALLGAALGTIAGATWVQSWGVVTRGHFRITAYVAVALAVLVVPAAFSATVGVDGGGTQRVLVAIFAASAVTYLAVQYGQGDAFAAVVGTLSAAVGVLALVATAGLLAQWPLWQSAVSLLMGAGLWGVVINGMLLGHWYLNQPGLKPWALARLTVAGLIVTVAALALGLVGVGKLIGAPTGGAALGLPGLGANFGPAFFYVYLALVLFTGAVIWAARRCVVIRSIQSATGLFYVAILTAGVSEFLVRYLMVQAT